MKLEQYKKDSYEFSKATSDLIRQFAFAGVAIIWIFKLDNSSHHLIPSGLFFPLLCMIGTLAFDLFQYLIPAIMWSIFYMVYEKRNRSNPDADIKASRWMTAPGWACFILKVASVITGYIFIILHIIGRI